MHHLKRSVLASLFLLVGCQHSKGRLLDNGDGYVVYPQRLVACCRDTVGGVMSYPVSVPQSHRNYCESVRRNFDVPQNGILYLAMGVDCGIGRGYVGDEYYE